MPKQNITLPDKQVTYVRFSASTIRQLDDLALREETNRSTVIRGIVLKALRERETAAKSAA